MSAITSRLSQGELLLGLGALVLLGVEVLFWWVLREYGISDTVIVLAGAVLFLMWLQKSGRTAVPSYTLVLVVLGLGLALLGIDGVVGTLRTFAVPGFSFGGIDLLAEILYWVGAALSGLGAFLLWRPGVRIGA